MKKIITILIIALAAYSAFYWLVLRDKIIKDSRVLIETQTPEENLGINNEEILVKNPYGKFCFSRNQIATEEAPYSVEEYIELNFNENMVSGFKKGMQAGPDMTNGYQGTLKGERVNDLVGVIFSYTIEGSAQKEKEEYLLKGGNLVKQRYSLVEDDDLLVPDKDSEMTEIGYIKDLCE